MESICFSLHIPPDRVQGMDKPTLCDTVIYHLCKAKGDLRPADVTRLVPVELPPEDADDAGVHALMALVNDLLGEKVTVEVVRDPWRCA